MRHIHYFSQCVSEVLSLEVKHSEHEADYSHLSTLRMTSNASLYASPGVELKQKAYVMSSSLEAETYKLTLRRYAFSV
jgi:hypothetical protein